MALPPLDLHQNLDLPNEPVDGDGTFWWRGERGIGYHNIRKWHGRHWAKMLQNSLGISDINHEWRGVRPLGKGGQGWAALYERRDHKTGRSLDSVVLKQELKDPNITIPGEAIAMSQANRQNCPNIVQLRSFKRFQNSKRSDHFRFYLEYCQHGDLHIINYRNKHFGKYFPELFIWHVFHDLANAVVAFARGAWSSWDAPGQKGRQLVHFDIKSTNVFLSDPRPNGDRDTRLYPTAKIGDFGLAEITYAGDKRNPQDFIRGTPDYMAPEQDDMSAQFQEWWPPNRPKPWLPRRWFDEKHNVFAIGVVMWEILTLNYFHLPLVYHYDHGIQPDGHIMPSITTMRGSPQRPGKKIDRRSPDPGEYSEDLRTLIRECLHPNPAERPTAQELFDRIYLYLDECCAEEGNSGQSQNKVYYRGNEINDMKPGTLFFPLFPREERIRGRTDQPPVSKPGWVEEALLRAERFRKQVRQDRRIVMIDQRNTIDAPIIFPKLRWFPSKNEFYLMKKRQRRGTRWASTQPPETLYNLFEEVQRRNGSTRIQKKAFNFDRRRREKNVWIGKYREHGTLRREKLEVAAHKPPAPPPPPPPLDDSDGGSSEADHSRASTPSYG